MDRAKDKGGWSVCERLEKIRYLSRRFDTEEKALQERDRMSKLPGYLGRSLLVTFETYEPKKKQRVRPGLRQSRH